MEYEGIHDSRKKVEQEIDVNYASPGRINKYELLSAGSGYQVKDPERYGVVEFDSEFKVLSLEEKRSKPKSNYAVVGLYFYDNNVVKIAENTKPSNRGELEITDINKEYLKKGKLEVTTLDQGFAWLDTGTHDSLLEAGHYVQTIEKRQGLKIACLEEIAYRNKWIDKSHLIDAANFYNKSDYGNYLLRSLDFYEDN